MWFDGFCMNLVALHAEMVYCDGPFPRRCHTFHKIAAVGSSKLDPVRIKFQSLWCRHSHCPGGRRVTARRFAQGCRATALFCSQNRRRARLVRNALGVVLGAHIHVIVTGVLMPGLPGFRLPDRISPRLSVSRNGGGSFMVYPQENSYLSNRVELVWGQGLDAEHTYACTCKFCDRFKIPCCHVLAVAKGVCELPSFRLCDNPLVWWGGGRGRGSWASHIGSSACALCCRHLD